MCSVSYSLRHYMYILILEYVRYKRYRVYANI